MCDVNRVGDVAQKFTDACRCFIVQFSACSDENNQRKHEDDDERFVYTVHPHMFAVTNSWNRKNKNDEQAAPPEGIPDVAKPDNSMQ